MLYIYDKYKGIDKILKNIASQEYIRDGDNKYNCVDFSEDLKQELEKNGISSIIITGKVPEGYHNWVAIEIEPITGEILKPDKYKIIKINK